MTANQISRAALSLLLKQKFSGQYALSFLDLRNIITGGKAMISSISEYEAATDTRLNELHDGLSLISNNSAIIFYNDKEKNIYRTNWTIAHELGHIFLGHKSDGNREQREANRFAAELLIPEPAVRFLDCNLGCRLSPQKMQCYFSASLSACIKRRAHLDRISYVPSDLGNELIRRLFFPSFESVNFENDIFFNSVL